jgi:hypothetical protein
MSEQLLDDPTTETDAPSEHAAALRTRRKRVVLGALLLAAAYSWLASHLDLTRLAPLVVGLPMVVAAVAAFRSWTHHDRIRERRREHRPRLGGLHHRSVLAWSVLAAALITWELRELTGSPRVDYPTVTSIVSGVITFRPMYVLAFLAWLVLGYRLIERCK